MANSSTPAMSAFITTYPFSFRPGRITSEKEVVEDVLRKPLRIVGASRPGRSCSAGGTVCPGDTGTHTVLMDAFKKIICKIRAGMSDKEVERKSHRIRSIDKWKS